MHKRALLTSLHIGLVFSVASGAWIIISDSMLAGLGLDAQAFTLYQTVKGLTYVILTGLLLVLASERFLVRFMHRELELAHAREQGRVTQETLQALVRSSPLPILVTDASGRVELWNEAATRTFGWAEGEVLGELLPFLPSPEDGGMRAAYARVLSGESLDGVAISCQARDGQTLYMLFFISPLKGEAAKVEKIMVIASNITEVLREKDILAGSLKEKEVLLKEVHHRVKNNMQVIYSLASLQHSKARTEEARLALAEIKRRIMTMASVHEHLYKETSPGRIEFSSYARDLASKLLAMYALRPELVCLDLRFHEAQVELHKAIPLALILSELMSNTLRHGLDKGGRALIRLAIVRDGELIRVEYSDLGELSGQLDDLRTKGTFGLMMIELLAGQLGGNLEVSTQGGVSYRLAFPA